MTKQEYHELFESLCYGHETELCIEHNRYFLEWEKSKLMIYQLFDKEGKLIAEITGTDKTDIVNRLFDSPILCGLSLNCHYENIQIVDIE